MNNAKTRVLVNITVKEVQLYLHPFDAVGPKHKIIAKKLLNGHQMSFCHSRSPMLVPIKSPYMTS